MFIQKYKKSSKNTSILCKLKKADSSILNNNIFVHIYQFIHFSGIVFKIRHRDRSTSNVDKEGLPF